MATGEEGKVKYKTRSKSFQSVPAFHVFLFWTLLFPELIVGYNYCTNQPPSVDIFPIDKVGMET